MAAIVLPPMGASRSFPVPSGAGNKNQSASQSAPTTAQVIVAEGGGGENRRWTEKE